MTFNTPSRGFTFVEILLTVVVLGIGSILVQQTLLRSASLISRTSDTVRMQVWLDEKLWDARQKIVYADFPSSEGDSGDFELSRRRYVWNLEAAPLSIGPTAFLIRTSVRPENDNSGEREAVRETYAVSRKAP